MSDYFMPLGFFVPVDLQGNKWADFYDALSDEDNQ